MNAALIVRLAAGVSLAALSAGEAAAQFSDWKSGANGKNGTTSCTPSSGSNGGSSTSVNGAPTSSSGSGLYAQATGGSGGNGGSVNCSSQTSYIDASKGGSGGYGGSVTITYGSSSSQPNLVSTGVGFSLRSAGGVGGYGGETWLGVGGAGGAGGGAGAINVTNYGAISTSNANSDLLNAISQGGAGGAGGYSGSKSPGLGGVGGSGGSVTITNANTLSATGSYSDGIIATSSGGEGALGGEGSLQQSIANGGAGGGVSIANSGAVTTSSGYGVAGRSLSRLNADGGGVSITNSGAVTAGGSKVVALEALSVGNKGGDFAALQDYATTYSTFAQLGGAGSSWSSGGTVSITNSASLRTSGAGSAGLVALSIGAGGGLAHMTSGDTRVGASEYSSGNGASVTVSNTHEICTGGTCADTGLVSGAGRAPGLVALSVSGGGGLASYGLTSTVTGRVTLGATGDGGAGSGGSGGSVFATAGAGIVTREHYSPGVVAGSVGGGGGVALGSLSLTSSASTTGATLGGANVAGGAPGSVGLNCKGAWSTACFSAMRPAAASGASTAVKTFGAGSPGLAALSVGGGGGLAGFGATIADAVNTSVDYALGAAGSSGSGMPVYAARYGGSVSTGGANSAGLVGLSVGAGGGYLAASLSTTRTSGDTKTVTASLALGNNGTSWGSEVAVETDTLSPVTTSGDQSHGVVGLSVGAGGGVLGWNASADYNKIGASLRVGGTSTSLNARGGTVDVTNASAVSTSGANAYGVFSGSIGGGGGLAGYTIGTSSEIGAATTLKVGGLNGSSSAVTLANQANVTISGAGGGGLAAMSIAGGGGSAGAVYATAQTLNGAFTNRIAGSATSANTSGAVTIVNSGGVSVASGKAQRATPAILAMSVAGGGGRSSLVGYGSLSGTGTLTDEVGATSSVAGNAGAVSVTNSAGAGASTAGDVSPSIVAMSVAGEGGFGGMAINGTVDSVALGWIRVGTGAGAGGKAGAVSVTNDGSASINGAGSPVLLAQSIGGSGGYGGWAFNTVSNQGEDSFWMLLGGSGGAGGASGAVSVTGGSAASVSASKGASPGALAQSISGSGGFAFAVFGTGLTSVSPYITLGGSGAANTTASTATISLAGSITTNGQLSPGAMAQSIGGDGGFAAYAFTGGVSSGAPTASISLGGSNGSSQHAAAASASMTGTIGTQAVGSHALAAQSIGGGGGFAGEVWTMSSVAADNTQYLSQLYRLGSVLGGGRGAAASATLVGNATTAGWASAGVSALSVGDGGGETVGYSKETTNSFRGTSFVLGGNAASGQGDAGVVTVSVNAGAADKRVSTTGNHSPGVVAQSVGAGGGRAVSIVHMSNAAGGFGVEAEMGSFGDPVGGAGGAVSVTVQGSIATSGHDSTALFAQSLSGGGGYVSASMLIANAPSSTTTPGNQQALAGSGSGLSSLARSGYDSTRPFVEVISLPPSTRGSVVGATLGGFGFQARDAGSVTVLNDAAISAVGTIVDGIAAQSVGGGGGRFIAANQNASSALSGSLTLGGGGFGGKGAAVSVTTTGAMNLESNGSHGVLAQSIGGGGGDARIWQTMSKYGGTSAVAIDHGMVVGASSIAGGAVLVTNSGQIALGGAASNGVLAQSVGGGGGYSSLIQTNTTAYPWTRSSTLSSASAQAGVLADASVSSSANNAASGAEGGTMMGAQTSVNGGNALALTLGSAAGTSGKGADVSVTNQATIGRIQDKTIGDASAAILAQSIGAGGGASQHYARNMDEQQSSIAFTLGGSGTAGGEAGTVTVTNNTTDSTKFLGASGPAAMGVVAQSVSGGGGVALSSRSTTLGGGSLAAALTLGASTAVMGSAGEVRVTTGGSITTGTGAPAVVAQSISSGGGVAKVFATAADNGTSYSTSAGTATASSGATSATTTSGVAAAISLGSWSSVSPYDVGAVTVSSSSTIDTNGLRSIGIVAQAVAGGGGLADVIGKGVNGGNFAGAFSFGGQAFAVSIPDLKVTSSGAITTGGALAHGVVAQSINLGGGVAGAATLGNTKSAGATTMQAQLGAISTASPSRSPLSGKVKVEVSNTVSTGGDGSSGVVAQSIAGGGGLLDVSLRAGSGSSTSTQSIAFGGTSPGVALNVEIDDTAATNSVSTAGFFSHGLVAQSVGQGGGLAMGLVSRGDGESSFNLIVSTSSKTGGLIDTATDGPGRQEGSAIVSNKGAITTVGALSAGVLAQAVTSGGASGVRAKIASSGSISTTYAIGGATDTVTFADYAKITNSGVISTSGDYAAGLVAQSVPHGGLHGFVGDLVSSVASSTLTATLGASAETSANYVAVSNSGAITTQGFGAVGILAQAIGGGGGALFHKAGATSVDVTLGGSSRSAYGSEWTSNDQTYRVNVSTAGVTTAGDFAAGVIAQAIGGGGGVAGWSGAPSGAVRLGARQSSDLSVGAGSGDKVNVSVSGAVSTAGFGAIGVMAQSIGGGGGAALGRAASAHLGSAALSAANDADGKDVTVTLDAAVTTSGAGAIGVLAQSIGGGGGVAFVTGTGSFGPSTPIVTGPVSPTPSADAGKVTVNVNKNITVSGVGSAGVLAQSIGGGGGLLLKPDGALTSAATATGGPGDGRDVTINVGNATILASGAYSYGVIGQSLGGGGGIVLTNSGATIVEGDGDGSNGDAEWVKLTIKSSVVTATGVGGVASLLRGSEIDIDAGSVVMGGTGSGSAVVFLGAHSHDIRNSGFLGSRNPLDGHAVTSSAGVTTISNSGVMQGAMRLAPGANSVNNLSGGAYLMGATVDLGGGRLSNDGLLSASAPVTLIIADLTQSSTGRLRVLSDLAGGTGSLVQVLGSARLAGQMTPFFVNGGRLRSGAYASGELFTASNGLTLDPGFTMGRTAIVSTTTRASANGLGFDAVVNFMPQGLSSLGLAIGRVIDYVQGQGSNDLFRPIVDHLVNVVSVSDFERDYVTLTTNAVAAAQQSALDATRRTTEAFADRADLWRKGGVSEQGWRAWATPFAAYSSVERNGRTFDARSFGGVAGVDIDMSTNTMLGLGAALGQSRFSYGDKSWGNQDFGGAALYGAWKRDGFYVSGVGYVGAMRADLTRSFGMLTNFADAKLSLDGTLVAGRLEIGRSFGLNGFELTPFAAIAPAVLMQKSATESVTINATGATHPGVTYLSQDARALPAFLGAQIGVKREMGDGAILSLDLRAAWRHEFLDTRKVSQEFAMAPGLAFRRETAAAAKDALDLKLRADWTTKTGLRLFGEVGASVAGQASSVSARGGVQIAW